MATVEEAREMCEAKTAEINDEVKRVETHQGKLVSVTEDLKKKLKAKFGNQIQLEDDE